VSYQCRGQQPDEVAPVALSIPEVSAEVVVPPMPGVPRTELPTVLPTLGLELPVVMLPVHGLIEVVRRVGTVVVEVTPGG
jgi:hypothetical protein